MINPPKMSGGDADVWEDTENETGRSEGTAQQMHPESLEIIDPQESQEALAGGDSVQKNAIMVGSYREPDPCLNPCWSCDSSGVNK